MLKRIGALWRPKQESKVSLSGTISFLGEDVRVVVLKNDKKAGDRDPDFILHRAFDDEQGPGQGSSRGREPGGDL